MLHAPVTLAVMQHLPVDAAAIAPNPPFGECRESLVYFRLNELVKRA